MNSAETSPIRNSWGNWGSSAWRSWGETSLQPPERRLETLWSLLPGNKLKRWEERASKIRMRLGYNTGSLLKHTNGCHLLPSKRKCIRHDRSTLQKRQTHLKIILSPWEASCVLMLHVVKCPTQPDNFHSAGAMSQLGCTQLTHTSIQQQCQHLLAPFPRTSLHFRLNIRRSFFPERVSKAWNRLPQDVVESPYLKVLRRCV